MKESVLSLAEALSIRIKAGRVHRRIAPTRMMVEDRGHPPFPRGLKPVFILCQLRLAAASPFKTSTCSEFP
jgi:hypothetical protein